MHILKLFKGVIMGLSVLILAYNEERLIRKTVLETLKYLKRLGIDFEIIICINGSTDRTEKIVKKLPVKYISIKQKGVGIALRKGIQKATKEWVIFYPGDGEGELEFIGRALKETKNYDFIIGSRYTRKQTRGASLLRKTLSVTFVILTRLLFSNEFSEMGITKLFRREWAKRLPLKSIEDDIQLELNYYAIKDKLRIKEVYIRNLIRRPASQSKANLIKASILYFKSLISYGVRLKLGI